MRAVRKLKNNKACGVDGIAGELLKYGGVSAHNAVLGVLRSVWDTSVMPTEWEEGTVIWGDKGQFFHCFSDNFSHM